MPQNPLDEIIKAKIADAGPMTVAEYMQLALAYPEYGYYMRKDPLGAEGDFTTAPEISQVFGELVGAWLASQWLIMDKPECALVELGPGRGTLMNDILRATKHVSGFHDAVSVHLVETSPVLKQKQWQALARKHGDITWHEQFSDVPEMPLLLIANEFFDALPIRQFVEDGTERMVSVMPAQAGIKALCWTPAAAGVTKETCEPAEQIMRDIATRISTHSGAALIVDYGYAEGHGDTLQAVREHQYSEVLKDPGMADLTAHVDFSALKKAAEGCAVYGPVPQGAFLTRLGVAERIERLAHNASDDQVKELYAGVRRLTEPKQMGELFKVLGLCGKDMEKPEGF
jgi:NADH dehydrogenase [ubiquinone] 1 alpha subcomplex assembly factor 7